MESAAIDQVLERAEDSVRAGRGLSGTGFWPAVAAVKRNADLVEEHGARIAAIDRAAFEDWALFKVPIAVGTALLGFGLFLGLVLISLAYPAEGSAAIALFWVGFVALLAASHGLGHLIVGRLVGIRFTHWFIGSVKQPQPGVKVDYASYLRTPPSRRAWMHASGAIATKLVPFVLLGMVSPAGLPMWVFWSLIVLGLAMIATDVAWSTKSSDWKKFRRERHLASHGPPR